MAFWWVNHKQSHETEVGEGFLWSPKTKKNGNKHIPYENMAKVQPGDIIFSYANKEINAIGTALTPAYTEQVPDSHNREGWLKTGWKLNVSFILLEGETRQKGKDIVGDIANLLPENFSMLKDNGNANEYYLCELPNELANKLINLHPEYKYQEIIDNLKSNSALEIEKQLNEDKELARVISSNPNLSPTEKEAIIKARIGQGKFKDNVCQIEKCCRITGTYEVQFLIASHIKPWRESVHAPDERLDGNNGLLLAPHVDKLFDNGYISFNQNGTMIVSSELDQRILEQWRIDPRVNVGAFSDAQEVYLKFHRDVVFKGYKDK